MTKQIGTTAQHKSCAVYCRVSSDEGLVQEFNSIDAQLEAGQAFIASQRSEGWIGVAERYEDGGFSGGNMERPALKRLLADIAQGKIAIVVVYKIDRLTRSLADFSKMVEVFEAHGVSFVSVTQQFNTTTSMGRLMLNVLLSFAQFEREVTGERVRDKIAAAKKKGMWMGGTPPLGYDVIERKLVINEAEAAIVRRVFKEMVRIGSPTAIAAQLNAEGITTKAWTTQEGQQRSGRPITRQYLHALLRHRIYLGEMSYKGQWYPGEQAPIIDPDLWERVQAMQKPPSPKRTLVARVPNNALLRGVLYNSTGEPMYPTYTRKPTRVYRYYMDKSQDRFGSTATSRADARVPAEDIEAAVVAQIRTVLTSPEAISAVIAKAQHTTPAIDEATAVMALGRLEDVWEHLQTAERTRIVTLMIARVEIAQHGQRQGIRITWHPLGWRALIGEFTPHAMGAELLEVER